MIFKVILFGILSSVLGHHLIGEKCRDLDGTVGKCELLINCSQLISRVMERQPYIRCGFKNFEEIVCCIPVNNSTTTETRTVQIDDVQGNSSSVIGILEEKCKEYSKAVYQNVGTGGTNARIDTCALRNIPRIVGVGGYRATKNEFPHMALIGFGQLPSVTWACGGTLISDEYVLSAAHCMSHRFYGTVSIVRLGEYNYSSTADEEDREDFGISKIYAHPLYSRTSKYHDIALLQLDRKVSFDASKRPACLSTVFEGPESRGVATGWGATDWTEPGSDVLIKVPMKFFNHTICSAAYDSVYSLENGIQWDRQVCAGSDTERRDTCQGDSGGPLQVYHPKEYCIYSVVGVTSFGVACGTIGIPGVYTRVFHYIDWIQSIVWPNE